jgi:hypothetical protein
MSNHSPKRILAVDPGMQHLGVAVLQDEELLWYGIKTFPGTDIARRRLEAQQYLTKIFARLTYGDIAQQAKRWS